MKQRRACPGPRPRPAVRRRTVPRSHAWAFDPRPQGGTSAGEVMSRQVATARREVKVTLTLRRAPSQCDSLSPGGSRSPELCPFPGRQVSKPAASGATLVLHPTHTHTHARSHACTFTHTRTCKLKFTHSCMHNHMHAHTCTLSHIGSRAHAHTRMHTHTHAHMHTYTCEPGWTERGRLTWGTMTASPAPS